MVIILEHDLSIKHSVNGRFLGVIVLITKSSKSPEGKKKQKKTLFVTLAIFQSGT